MRLGAKMKTKSDYKMLKNTSPIIEENLDKFLDWNAPITNIFSGKMTAEDQRKLFGLLIGRGEIVIDGREKTVIHYRKANFGRAIVPTVAVSWSDLPRLYKSEHGDWCLRPKGNAEEEFHISAIAKEADLVVDKIREYSPEDLLYIQGRRDKDGKVETFVGLSQDVNIHTSLCRFFVRAAKWLEVYEKFATPLHFRGKFDAIHDAYLKGEDAASMVKALPRAERANFFRYLYKDLSAPGMTLEILVAYFES